MRLLAAVLLLLTAPLTALAQSAPADTRTAVFAGGCFWCTEADFEKVPGVISAVSGYTGGSEPEPTYEQVASNQTGHYEAVQVTFDPAKVSYGTLVTQFWRTVDPTDSGGQFCDRGRSYRTAVFVTDARQRAAAEVSKAAAQRRLGRAVVTPILPAARFWPAEAYHQDYAGKNPLRYATYRKGCGRDAKLRALWGGR